MFSLNFPQWGKNSRTLIAITRNSSNQWPLFFFRKLFHFSKMFWCHSTVSPVIAWNIFQFNKNLSYLYRTLTTRTRPTFTKSGQTRNLDRFVESEEHRKSMLFVIYAIRCSFAIWSQWEFEIKLKLFIIKCQAYWQNTHLALFPGWRWKLITHSK